MFDWEMCEFVHCLFLASIVVKPATLHQSPGLTVAQSELRRASRGQRPPLWAGM